MEPDGDVEGYEKFFREVEPTLRRVAFLHTGNTDQACDLAQETLVRAWQHWPKVSRHPHPDAWCCTVLHNLARSHWRRAALERSRSTDKSGQTSGPSADHLDIVAALRRLSANQQHAIILHDVVGYTADEIALELHTSPGTVRSWLSRGRETLWHDLADRLPEQAKGGRT